MSPAVEKTFHIRNGLLKTKVLTGGNGPPVVFLHGLTGVTWDDFLEDLSAHFTVYAPLHPGLTEPEDIREITSLWDLVLYHYELFDALGLETPTVIGHSYGGMLAAEVAATNPERVSKLVLIDALGFWLDDHPITDWTAMEPMDLSRISVYDPDGEVAQRLTAVPDELEAQQDQIISTTWALACTAKFIWPIPDKGLKDRTHRIKAPTLVIWGRNDGIIDQVYAQEFAERITNAPVQVQVLDQAGHLPHMEQRQQVAGLIRGFLK